MGSVNIQHLRQDLKIKWLTYYKKNRRWLIRMKIWGTFDGYRRPASGFILAAISALEPKLAEIFPFALDLSNDPDDIITALGLNFNPEENLHLIKLNDSDKPDSSDCDSNYYQDFTKSVPINPVDTKFADKEVEKLYREQKQKQKQEQKPIENSSEKSSYSIPSAEDIRKELATWGASSKQNIPQIQPQDKSRASNQVQSDTKSIKSRNTKSKDIKENKDIRENLSDISIQTPESQKSINQIQKNQPQINQAQINQTQAGNVTDTNSIDTQISPSIVKNTAVTNTKVKSTKIPTQQVPKTTRENNSVKDNLSSPQNSSASGIQDTKRAEMSSDIRDTSIQFQTPGEEISEKTVIEGDYFDSSIDNSNFDNSINKNADSKQIPQIDDLRKSRINKIVRWIDELCQGNKLDGDDVVLTPF